ncbi:serine hydrolase [Paenibacillus sp. LMG 31458]|uniref:Serine hydrolase n=1 Tax=Paenibacillus phytorum TaxID=2654977 RepID=A0ABX1Y4Q9_9BACL|nr:serine hydrolase [Paenibacillus phytorum]
MRNIAFQEYLSTLQSRNEFSGTVLLSNREHQVMNTADTKFRIGSITKQFTAMAIMMVGGTRGTQC